MVSLWRLLDDVWDILFCERHIMITVAVHKGQTLIKIDVQDPFDVESSRLFCMLGFGLGFGAVLLYRFYRRYYKSGVFQSFLPPRGHSICDKNLSTPKEINNPRDNDSCHDNSCHDNNKTIADISPATDDSGLVLDVAMGDLLDLHDPLDNASLYSDVYDDAVKYLDIDDWPMLTSDVNYSINSYNSRPAPRPRSLCNSSDPDTEGHDSCSDVFRNNKSASNVVRRRNRQRSSQTFGTDYMNTSFTADSGIAGSNATSCRSSCIIEPNYLYDGDKFTHRFDTRIPPLNAEYSTDSCRSSMSPVLRRSQTESRPESPFSVQGGGSSDMSDWEFNDLFSKESETGRFFEDLENELLTLKNEIEDIDGTIRTLCTEPETAVGPVDNTGVGRNRNRSREGSVDTIRAMKTSPRPSPPRSIDSTSNYATTTSATAAANTSNNIINSNVDYCDTSNTNDNELMNRKNTIVNANTSPAGSEYHVHVHVHVHDNKGNAPGNVPASLPLNLPLHLPLDPQQQHPLHLPLDPYHQRTGDETSMSSSISSDLLSSAVSEMSPYCDGHVDGSIWPSDLTNNNSDN